MNADKTIISISDKFRTVNKLDTDFKAEIVAAGLIETGVDAEKIVMVRENGDKRHVSKDIAKIEHHFSSQDLMEYLYIHTNRYGIYDAIPENILHQPFNSSKQKNQEDIISEIRHHRQEEFYARHFFRPFEMIIDRLMIDVHIYERRFDKKNFYGNLQNILSRYTPVLKLMTLKQAVFFIKVIPMLRRLTKDYTLMGQVLGILLEAPVKVTMGKLSTITVENSSDIISDEWILDVNSVLEDTLQDGYRGIEITIGPMDTESIISYYPGHKNENLLNQLLAMMLPANLVRNIEFETIEGEDDFYFSGDDSYTVYLDINTRL